MVAKLIYDSFAVPLPHYVSDVHIPRGDTYSFHYSFYQHSLRFPPNLVHRGLIPFVLPVSIHAVIFSGLDLNFDKV